MVAPISVGFDYGTSHCAMGVLDAHQADQVNLIPLTPSSPLVASTLFAWDRSFIYDFVADHISDPDERQRYTKQFTHFLRKAHQLEDELDIPKSSRVLFGDSAFEQYAKGPTDGHYLRSPKSFLGSTGLNAQQLLFIEQVVAAMMMQFKTTAENHCQAPIENAVIGRPINFQGLRGEESNQQAITILSQAARLAGFKNIAFLYEPLAAGIDFEARLEKDRTVLVIDIGGGTSDCSLIRMGPTHRQKSQREDDFLAHCGQRIGGNDFDIHLSFNELMPLLGSQSTLLSGRPMPTQPYWYAVETNNAGSQIEFFSTHNDQRLKALRNDSTEPWKVDRLITLRNTNTNFRLVSEAEKAKITLSTHTESHIDLSFIEPGLQHTAFQQSLPDTFKPCLNTIRNLISETLKLGGTHPDCVYITGGMGQSPLIKNVIHGLLDDIEILSGNYFSSVTVGLTRWAHHLFA